MGHRRWGLINAASGPRFRRWCDWITLAPTARYAGFYPHPGAARDSHPVRTLWEPNRSGCSERRCDSTPKLKVSADSAKGNLVSWRFITLRDRSFTGECVPAAAAHALAAACERPRRCPSALLLAG